MARHAATWLARIDALLPAGVNELVHPWGVRCEGPAFAADWLDVQGGYSRAFEVTAQNVAADAATARRARRAAIEPVTVQVFAGSVRAARALAERINDDEKMGEWRGFYDAVGFPANNPAAHVVRAVLPGGASVHRVLVGAYLGIADAAFAKLPPGVLDDLLKPENKERLRSILTYHVVPGRLMSRELMKERSRSLRTVHRACA